MTILLFCRPYLLFLLPLLSRAETNATQTPTANSTNVTTSILQIPQTLSSVSCPSSQTIFTAVTEMVFEGRSDLLSKDERHETMVAFEGIYNALTQRSCDSYFRRIANLTWVSMSNDLGELVYFTPNANATTTMEVEKKEGGERMLQEGTSSFAPTSAPTFNSNSTSVPETSIVYEVTGTCRGCPVTRAGSFELYDDAFRRALSARQGMSIRMRQLAVVRSVTVEDLNAYSNQPVVGGRTSPKDCQCVEGMDPEVPQAPGVQECVDEMNLEFNSLRTDKGLFLDLELEDLVQLDEGFDELVDDGMNATDDAAKSDEHGRREREEHSGAFAMDGYVRASYGYAATESASWSGRLSRMAHLLMSSSCLIAFALSALAL